MSSLYEAAILNAWRHNNDEISLQAAKDVYFEIYFEKNIAKFTSQFENVLENLKRISKNYNLYYDTRRQAERDYDKYTAIATQSERVKAYAYDQFNQKNGSNINKILRKYGRSKVFHKGIWIYDPEYSHAVTKKNEQEYIYYKAAYECIIKAFENHITSRQNLNSCFKEYKDSIKIEWMLPEEKYYCRGAKIVLKLNIGPAYFEFNFDVRRFSVGMANLWTRYNYKEFADEENNLIYFTNDDKNVDFYELFTEIDRNTSFVLNFLHSNWSK
jgi:hypothetical protein